MQIIREIQDNWKLILLSIVIALFLISFNNAQAAAGDLNVNLSYREMIALGPDAEARLMLVNPVETENNLIIRDLNKKLKNGVPVNFKLDLTKAEIEADNNYQLFAVIKWEGDMIWSANKRLSGRELLDQKEINFITKRTPARMLFFTGEKDLQVRFLNGLAQVIIDQKEYMLPQQRTASGAKFANSEISIWNKGREMLIEKNNKSYNSSLISLAQIDRENNVIKARGEEPYWEVKIDKNRLELKYDYLANKIIIPRDNIEVIEKENYLLYRAETTFLNLEIKIMEDIHNNVMNGRIYPLTAFIKINKQKFIGGADLD